MGLLGMLRSFRHNYLSLQAIATHVVGAVLISAAVAFGSVIVGWLSGLPIVTVIGIGTSAVLALVALALWAVEGKRKSPVEAPKRLTGDEAKALWLERYWGDRSYKASSEWNADENQAYLYLKCKDAGQIGARITATDRSGSEATHEFHTHVEAEGVVTDNFPARFKKVSDPLVDGDYRVEWEVLVSGGIWAPADSSDFTIPPSNPTTEERPSGYEIKYPSGRQDAVVTPKRMAAAGQVQQQREVEPTANDRSDPRPGKWFPPPTQVEEEAEPRHRQVGEQIELQVRKLKPVTPMLGSSILCEVDRPDGSVSKAVVPHWSSTSGTILYPFKDSPPLVDGEYVVVWSMSFLGMSSPAARDLFRVRGGELVR